MLVPTLLILQLGLEGALGALGMQPQYALREQLLRACYQADDDDAATTGRTGDDTDECGRDVPPKLKERKYVSWADQWMAEGAAQRNAKKAFRAHVANQRRRAEAEAAMELRASISPAIERKRLMRRAVWRF